MLICSNCKKQKIENEFHRRNNIKRGFSYYCKECSGNKRKARYESNKSAELARQKQYVEAHRKEKAAYLKQWACENKSRLKQYKQKYYQENKEKLAANKIDYYQNNKLTIKSRHQTRMRQDLNYRLAVNLRKRIGVAIRSHQKTGSAIDDLGCTVEFFRCYIEQQFQPKMSWDNWNLYGWHLDHIIPLSSFDLTDRDQFLKACHYTNYQPLWASDNYKKGSKPLK